MMRTDFLLAARRLALPVAAMFLVLTGSGCNGSKAFTKRGAKMEEAGMMEQAAGFYFTAVQKDKMNTEAMQGLRRTGQWVLNDRLTAFDGAMLRDEKAAAVKAYEEADAYFKKVDAVGVRLDFPETKRMAYNQVKNSHMDDLYRKASRALEEEQFDAALTDLTEILRLEPAYKDARALADVAYCEPRYRQGTAALAAKTYRAAHTAFKACTDRLATFKDAAARRDEALAAGQFTVALLPFANGTTRVNVETKLRSYVQQRLSESTDPFLKIVDRENQALILQEQQMALSGVLNATTAVQVGGLLGAKAMLKGIVVDCDVVDTELERYQRQGMESYQVERVNSEGKKYTETEYRPVQYMEFAQTRQVKVTFNVQLISLETGATLASEMVTHTEHDAVRYAKYSGNVQNIYPTHASGGVNRAGRTELQALLGARQNPKDESLMINAAMEATALRVRSVVENQLRILVP